MAGRIPILRSSHVQLPAAAQGIAIRHHQFGAGSGNRHHRHYLAVDRVL